MKFVVTTLAIVLLITSCGSKENALPAKAAPASSPNVIEMAADSPKLKQIGIATVVLAEMPTDEFTAPGKVEVNPNRLSKIVLPVAGRITEVKVKFGDAVTKDQVLMLVQSPEADAAAYANLKVEGDISQATSVLHKVESDLARIQDLFKGDAIAKKELIAAEIMVEQAQINLRQARTELLQTSARLESLGIKPGSFRQTIAVRAPLPGKITDITVVAGEYRNDLSAPLMTIADLSSVWVSAEVPESSIRLVKAGEAFDVSLSAFPGEIFHSRVTRLADSVDPQTRTLKVWAELANPVGRLRPEMFGEIRHIEAYHSVPVVPATAVIQAQGRVIVFREMSKGKFQMVEVTIGKRSGNSIPILKGLSPEDKVVVDGAMLLRGY